MGWDYELLDEGPVSGETIYERPQMIDLLEKVKTGEYEGCLIIEEERLSRSQRLGDWDDIKEAFRQGKAKIATPSKVLDPENIDDDFLIDLSGVLSKRDKRIILKRMTRGKAEKLKQGKNDKEKDRHYIDQVKKLRVLWGKRAECLSKKRHYHYHKTRNFYSLFEACRLIGISQVTFKKHEGILFPSIWRDEKAGRRLSTEKDIAQIKEIWEKHKKRNKTRAVSK